jgi:hypothetical protein
MLHGIVENYGFIYFSEILKTGLTILGCVGLFYLVVLFFTKKAIHAALICFFISTWMLFFGAIFDWVKSIHFLRCIHSYSVFIPLMLLSFLAFILFIRQKKSLQNKLCFYLNLLLLIYCLFDLSALALKSLKPNCRSTAANINIDTTLVKSKPNIYFMLFDEYPGYKSLKDSFAFANDSLYHFLEKKEFKILPTFSNYNMTFYSMASMLNMEYIDKPYKALENTMEDDQLRIKEIKNARAIQFLKTMGYSFTNYSIFDILDQPSLKGNSFVISQATLITHKIFFNKILKDLGWHFISGKYRIPYIKYIAMHENRNNQFIEKKLSETKPENISKPRFIYAHFNMPHPPIFYDSAGNYLPVEKMFDDQSYGNKQIFLSYLKYANTKIEDMVNAICKNDPGSVVIVMSDHGYRNYKNIHLIEPLHFDNICAVRFPGNNYLPVKERWSNVNFFRYLFNCEFNQRIPYLNDSSIFLKDKKLAN